MIHALQIPSGDTKRLGDPVQQFRRERPSSTERLFAYSDANQPVIPTEASQ